MAAVAVPRHLFADILPLIGELRPPWVIGSVVPLIVMRSIKNHGRRAL
jgi:hypothetical protein